MERLLHTCESYEQAFAAWRRQPPGNTLTVLEIASLRPILDELAGQHLLQIGASALLEEITLPRIRQRISICQQPHSLANSAVIQGSYSELPFLKESMDIVFLPHILEFAFNPQTILAEAWRVLASNGHLLIVGFNPWSLWGIARLLAQRQAAPWNGRFHSAQKWRRQISAWQGEIIDCKYIFFRPPFRNASLLKRSLWLESSLPLLLPASGAAYILLAKKHTIALTSLSAKLKWKTALLSAPKGLAQPSTRGIKREQNS